MAGAGTPVHNGTHKEVRGIVGVSSRLQHMCPGDQVQVVKVRGKHLYLPTESSHLTTPQLCSVFLM